MGVEDVDEEVVPEEAVTKDMAEKADTSTAQHINHRSETSREKWRIWSGFRDHV